MDKGYIEFATTKITRTRRPPQMKSSEAQIYKNSIKIPVINFMERQFTSLAGILIFQMLFKRLGLKRCFSHLKLSPIFGHHIIVQLLIVHLFLCFRKIGEIEHYREGSMILRLMGLRTLPDESTLSRSLALLDDGSAENVRRLSRPFFISGLQWKLFSRLTIDYDGLVLYTKGHAEDSAIGLNKTKKGARNYSPLFCTTSMTNQKVRFTSSVPSARFKEHKKLIESCGSWTDIDDQWSYFEIQRQSKSWNMEFLFVFTGKKYKKALKVPLQQDVFEPVDREYQSRSLSPIKRNLQNLLFRFIKVVGLKRQCLAVQKIILPSASFLVRGLVANREAGDNIPGIRQSNVQAPSAWRLQKLDTIRHRIVQRTGLFSRSGVIFKALG